MVISLAAACIGLFGLICYLLDLGLPCLVIGLELVCSCCWCFVDCWV